MPISSPFNDYVNNFYSTLWHYFGIRPPKHKKEIERTPVNSSNIKSVGYSPLNKVLEVEFRNNSRYHYPLTPQNKYDELMAAKSKGQYFHKHIRPTNLYEKVADAKNQNN